MIERNTITKLFALLSVLIFSLSFFILSIYNYNPFLLDNVKFVGFYISLFILIVSLSSLIQIVVNYIVFKNYAISDYFNRTIRTSSFFALACVSSAILRGIRVFDIWIAISIFITSFLLELFFRTKPISGKS